MNSNWLAPLAGEGTMVWQTVRMGEGPFVAMYPSPIIASGNTEVPSPARGEGTITATAAVDLTLGGMVQRDCVLPAGPLTSSSAPPRRAPAPRPPLLRPRRRRRDAWPRPRADSRVPGASEGGFLGGRRLAPRGGGEPAV